ncbi:unnamed protein product, partial [Adineta steineri]
LLELKHVCTVEQQILRDSQAFSLLKNKPKFQIETIFNWNEITVEDLREINQINLNDLFEEYIRYICKKKSCHHQNREVEKQTSVVKLDEPETNEDSIRSLSEHNSELNVDQPINEITHPHSSSSSLTLDIEQTNNLLENKPIVYENESIMLSSILTDILNDRLTTETLAGNNPLSSDRNNRRSS